MRAIKNLALLLLSCSVALTEIAIAQTTNPPTGAPGTIENTPAKDSSTWQFSNENLHVPMKTCCFTYSVRMPPVNVPSSSGSVQVNCPGWSSLAYLSQYGDNPPVATNAKKLYAATCYKTVTQCVYIPASQTTFDPTTIGIVDPYVAGGVSCP